MSDNKRSLAELLDEFAAHEHRQTAERLGALRTRLGRDGLSVDEWNALVGAASHLHVEAARREGKFRFHPSPPDEGLSQ